MDNELSRRRMVALSTMGGGAALLGTGSPAAGALRAPIAATGATLAPLGDPGSARIGSPPISGYSYVHRDWSDFSPENGSRATSTFGCYAVPAGWLVASVDLPAGAVVRDIEWYASSLVAMSTITFLWTTGMGVGGNPIDGFGIPAGSTEYLRAARRVLPSGMAGPYALGSKLQLYVSTGADKRVSGVRVGYTTSPSGSVLLPAPVRVYDSRSGAKIGNGQTRIHSLADRIPAGASGALVNLSITGGEKSGGLAAYNAGTSVPSGSALYWSSGSTVSNELHTSLSPDRRIKVTSRGVTGCKAHYFIDLVGYTA